MPSHKNHAIMMMYSQRRRGSFGLFALAYLASCVSGFTLSTQSTSCFVAAAESPSRETKLHVAPAYSKTFDILTTSAGILSDESEPPRSSQWTRKSKDAVTKLFPANKHPQDDEYERRKQEWADRYTNVESLRQMFGENRNKLWGDLDASTTRRLYKTLLPKVLLEMYKVGVHPEDLAPLAYQARLAAKLYARERCVVPARVFSAALDGIRQYKRYGKFQPSGMTYHQVWDKYEQLILEELGDQKDLTDEDVTAKICLKILEKSCTTNEAIDRYLLRESKSTKVQKAMKERDQDLDTVIDQLERDVLDLLKPNLRKGKESSASRIKTLRLMVQAKRRLDKLQLSDEARESFDARNKLHLNRTMEWKSRERRHRD